MSKKSTILCDVDGVLADMIGSLCLDVLGVLGESPTVSDFTQWEMEKIFTPEQWVVAVDIMDNTKVWQNMLPLKEGIEGIHKFVDAGHNVYFVTSQWDACETWVSQRQKWLKAMGLNPKNIVATKHKHLVCGDVLIDDKPEHVIEWSTAHNKEAALIDQPWNQGVSGYFRRHSSVLEVFNTGNW